MATFGRHLLERGVLDRAQLEDATQVMVVFGVRLGTILVEAGLLGVEELEAHLSRHLGVASAPPDRLLRPDPAALRQVSREVARRYQLLPMWIDKCRLHAAMLDPANPDRVDGAGFAMGLSVVPYVIAERRLVQLLEDHYPSSGSRCDELPRPGLAPAQSATERTRLEADLAMTGDRDSVVPTALRIAASYARVAAIFSVRDGLIQGVLAARGAASQPIDGLYVPAAEPSMLATAARGGVFHGSPARGGIDAIVARLLGGGEPREAAIVPVAVRGRVVQLLYVDNGADAIPPGSLSALGALCDGVAVAYERLISESTQRHC